MQQLDRSLPFFAIRSVLAFTVSVAVVAAMNVPDLVFGGTDFMHTTACGGMALAEALLGLLAVGVGPSDLPCMPVFGRTELLKALGYGVMAMGLPVLGTLVLMIGIVAQSLATAGSYVRHRG